MTDCEVADSLMTTKPAHRIKPVLLYLACASDPRPTIKPINFTKGGREERHRGTQGAETRGAKSGRQEGATHSTYTGEEEDTRSKSRRKENGEANTGGEARRRQGNTSSRATDRKQNSYSTRSRQPESHVARNGNRIAV